MAHPDTLCRPWTSRVSQLHQSPVRPAQAPSCLGISAISARAGLRVQCAVTPAIRAIQLEEGSRAGYARMDEGEDYNHRLGAREAGFIAARDNFYMASVGETGWPYVQHRGGPAGFMKVLDEGAIGFADYSGNRQFVSTGNFSNDNRVALFFMDYPNRTRLKMLGRVRSMGFDEPELLARLELFAI